MSHVLSFEKTVAAEGEAADVAASVTPNGAVESAERDAENPVIVREPGYSYVWHRTYTTLAFAAGDALAISLALLAAGALRLWLFGAALVPMWSWGLLPVWWSGAFIMGLFPGWGLGAVEELRRLVLLLCMTFAGVAIVLFLIKQSGEVSRLTMTMAFLFSLLLFPLVRNRIKRFLIALGLWGIPTAVYGAGATGRRVIRLLQTNGGLGYNPIALYDDDPKSWGEVFDGVPVLGSAERVMPYAPVAVLAMPGARRERLIELMEGPLAYYRTVVVIPNLFEAPSLCVRSRDLRGILGLEIKRNLSSTQARLTKRAIDLLLVLATAPLWIPSCAVIALLVWLEDRASPFFAQERVGTGGQVFTVWKFRTMVPHAEAVLRRKLDQDEELRREWQESYKLKNDPRITRVGNVLRRFSLDELPQLVNVLRGEMSLVGPRPLPAYHYEALPIRVRALRKRVWPGMTGLWQVHGRSNAGTQGMKKWDAYYVRNWSLWLDLVVLARTLRSVAKGSGAY